MNDHVCPWWVGYLLANPLRKLFQNPEQILQPYVKNGMMVLDIGCAMGFFTFPMARLVGENGHVVAVDLQEKMINSLRLKAQRARLLERIELRKCTSTSLEIDNLADRMDFALAFAVLHEMPDIGAALKSIARALRPSGKLLIAEPTGHVTKEEFGKTSALARAYGLEVLGSPSIRRSHTLELIKK